MKFRNFVVHISYNIYYYSKILKMSFSDLFTFLFLLVLIFILYKLTMNAEDCCGPLFMGLLFVTCMMSLGWLLSGPTPTINRQLFTVWNRSIRSNKFGVQVTDYRKPDIQLSAEEYLMGVEMEKSNSCHVFNFQLDSDINRYRRCTHFFPELITEYKRDFQSRVGVEL